MKWKQLSPKREIFIQIHWKHYPDEVSRSISAKSNDIIKPIENILVVIIPKITEHKDIIEDIEKKAKKATDKIKEGL